MTNRKNQRKKSKFNSMSIPFDMFSLNEPVFFPKVTEETTNTDLLNRLYRKNTQLMPSDTQKVNLDELLSKVQGILNRMMTMPYESNNFQIKDMIQVGSYKNDTMRSGKNTADLVLMLNLTPSIALIHEISARAFTLLCELQNTQIVPKSEYLRVEVTDKGFDLYHEMARVSILVAAYPEYIKSIKDLSLKNQVEISLAAVRHSKFLEENSNPFAKILSRVLRYIFQRNEKFTMMNPWMIDAFACYAIFSNYSNQPLNLNQAFLRVFQLLSTGIFSLNYLGITDPCENFRTTINAHLSLEEQEILCEAAQSILNNILKGNFEDTLDMIDINSEVP